MAKSSKFFLILKQGLFFRTCASFDILHRTRLISGSAHEKSGGRVAIHFAGGSGCLLEGIFTSRLCHIQHFLMVLHF